MTILLLDIPDLHLAYLGCYGNDWVATPNLDKLACEAVLFDNHFAGGPGDLHTGRCHFPRPTDPPQTGPERHWFLANAGLGGFHFIEPSRDASAFDERFSQVLHGIMAVLKKKPLPQKLLIWAEFPSLAPPWQLPPDLADAYFDEEADPDESDGEESARGPWLDPPAKLPAGDDAFDRLQFTYAAAATILDAQIGWLLDRLKKSKLLDQLLLVVTSSRSLPLGEHGWVGHQRAWQHEENVHLPLLMRLPQAEEAGLRIAALTQPVDVVPTLIDCMSLPAAALPGRSLWPLIRQEIAEVRPHACSGDRIGASVEWSLRTREWAYLLPLAVPADDPPRLPQLYVKPDDRWEVNDVCQHHPQLAEELDRTLRGFVDCFPSDRDAESRAP